VIEAIPASNDVNLPGLATTETLTRHVNLITFPKLCRGKAKSGWRMTIPGGSRATRKLLSFVGRISIDKRARSDGPIADEMPTYRYLTNPHISNV
jgi:hypothetical protein